MTERITDKRLVEIEQFWSEPETRDWFPAYDAVMELLSALKTERALVADLTDDYLRLRQRVTNAVKTEP